MSHFAATTKVVRLVADSMDRPSGVARHAHLHLTVFFPNISDSIFNTHSTLQFGDFLEYIQI